MRTGVFLTLWFTVLKKVPYMPQSWEIPKAVKIGVHQLCTIKAVLDKLPKVRSRGLHVELDFGGGPICSCI
jgi:hypothetical protein